LPFSPLALEVGPLNPAGVSEECCELPAGQQGAGRSTIFAAFLAEKDSDGTN